MKKLIIPLICLFVVFAAAAQDTNEENKKSRKEQREEKRRKIDELIRQEEEEGVLAFNKQSVFGIRLRTNGYGAFYELAKYQSQRVSMTYSIELDETKHNKEDKKFILFGNPYVYGKLNNFYNLKLGIGQQRIIGQKGNKNGVAVFGIYSGGVSVGFLRPYYVEYNNNGVGEIIKYTPEDSVKFVEGPIIGAAGFSKGWNELKLKPGAFAKAAIRFDWGRFNEVVSGLEAGISVEYYSSKIPLMLFQDDKQLFLQGHIAILFGRRK